MTSPQTYQPALPAAVPLPMSRQPSNVPSHVAQASTSGSLVDGAGRSDGEEGKGKPQPYVLLFLLVSASLLTSFVSDV